MTWRMLFKLSFPIFGVTGCELHTLRLWILAFIVLFSSTSCSKGSGASPALAPYAYQTLTPGVGLDDLRLGETTLEAFSSRFSPSRVSYIAGDHFGVGFSFKDDQISFLFVAEGACDEKLRWNPDLSSQFGELDTFLNQNPECRSMPLHSISMAAGDTVEDTFFRGTTDRGIKLFSMAEAIRGTYGEPQDVRGLLLAGSSDQDAKYNDFAYKSGIVFYIAEGREEHHKGQLVLQKIAIFRPN